MLALINKVNTFYRDKVEEVIEEAASLNKHMNALIAFVFKHLLITEQNVQVHIVVTLYVGPVRKYD